MERTKYWIVFFLFFLSVFKLKADFRSEVYNAYISNRMELWKKVIDRMDAVTNKDVGMLTELVNYQYGYIGYCIGINKKEEAEKYLELAYKNLEILEKQHFNLSLICAYKSAFYGYRIGLNTLSVPYNGLRSINYAREAVRLDAKNYLGYVQLGNIQFYMPPVIGGSKSEAIGHYLKAKELIEKDSSSISGNWNYLNLLIIIGQSYYYLRDYASARKIYEQILNIEPGFLYVKDELYPQLLTKIAN